MARDLGIEGAVRDLDRMETSSSPVKQTPLG